MIVKIVSSRLLCNPLEILLKIFRYVDLEDFPELFRVCRHIHHMKMGIIKNMSVRPEEIESLLRAALRHERLPATCGFLMIRCKNMPDLRFVANQENRDLLYKAIGDNCMEFAEWMLRKGVSLDKDDSHTLPNLVRTTPNNKSRNLQIFLKTLAANDKSIFMLENNNHRSPLISAVTKFKHNIVELLLQLNIYNQLDCNNALIALCRSPVIPPFQSHSNLYESYKYRMAKTFDVLMKYGAEINYSSLMTYMGIGSSIIEAAECIHLSSIDKFKQILQYKPNINLRGHLNNTALIYVCSRDTTISHEVVELLLDNGAKIDLKNDFGETALMKASQSGQEEIVKTLLKYKADVRTRNNRGMTAESYCKKGTKSGTTIKKILYQAYKDSFTCIR